MKIAAVLLGAISFIALTAVAPEASKTQLVWLTIGAVSFLLTRKLQIAALKASWWMWYLGAVCMLLVVFFMPEIRGSHRWIQFGWATIQPSEIAKPFIAVALAGFVSSLRRHNLSLFILTVVLFLVPFILIFKQPDLGNSIVFLFSFVLMLLASKFPMRYYVIPLGVSLLLMPLLWTTLEGYQKTRIMTFVNPSYDIQGAGYNARQALIAVGSGGFWGSGLGKGTQSSLRFLPEFHTDFIYATIVEQVGFAGGFLVIVLYYILLRSVLREADSPQYFKHLLATALFGQLFIQTVVNIGMNLGLFPITGITLPLVSFGGSSVLATCISLGIVDAFEKRQAPIAIR